MSKDPDLFSFVYIKALWTPRDSLTFRCLHFENSAHFRLHHISWICVFLFSASSSMVKKLPLGTVYLQYCQSQTGRNVQKMNILINIPILASQLLHNKLAQKVPSQMYSHPERKPVSCLLSMYILC